MNINQFKANLKEYTGTMNYYKLGTFPVYATDGDEIKELITPTVKIIDHLLPVYNYKTS